MKGGRDLLDYGLFAVDDVEALDGGGEATALEVIDAADSLLEAGNFQNLSSVRRAAEV